MTTESGELLTIPEAARLLKVSTVTLGRWLRAGRVPSYRVGPRAVRIRRADLDALLTPAHPTNGAADRSVPPTSEPVRSEGTVSMSLEQAKQYLATPPTPEEIARRQALVVRIKEARKERVITPATTADLVHMAGEEEYEPYGGSR